MELLKVLRTVRRRWRFAVGLFLVGVIGALLLTLRLEPQYESQVRVYVTATSVDSSTDSYQLGLYSQQRIASYADLATDDTVLDKVIRRVGVQMSPEELASNVTAEVVPGTVILRVSVTDPDPKVAQALTRAEGNEIVSLVRTLETPPPSADADASAEPPIYARIAGDATLDFDAVSPVYPLNLAVGALLGLMAGLAGAVVREMLDSTIKSPNDVLEASGKSVLTSVPFDRNVPQRPLIATDQSFSERSEVFRVLRTNLSFIDLDSKWRTLLVSSSVPGEGKSVTAANLALSLAHTGRRVLLVDADLRKPHAAQLLDLDPAVGLMSVLLDRETLAGAIQSHPSGLDFLAPGPLPPNPAEVLETNAARDLFRSLRDMYDVVIIDGPPLLPVADAVIMSVAVDGVLMVTRHGSTNRQLLRAAMARLEPAGVRVVGVVLNMVPRQSESYGYGYGYTPAIGAPLPAADVTGPIDDAPRDSARDSGEAAGTPEASATEKPKADAGGAGSTTSHRH